MSLLNEQTEMERSTQERRAGVDVDRLVPTNPEFDSAPDESNDRPATLEEHLFKKIEESTQLVHDIFSVETLVDLYELILTKTTSYFGFDYGMISRVDYRNRRVKTEIGKSIKPSLVDPDRWKDKSDYSLDDNDILVAVVKSKCSEIILGPEVEKSWDSRLNKHIFDTYNHKELVRVFVPFILRKSQHEQPQVFGVIEAGCHLSTRSAISKEESALFELFINQCAGAIQRVVLLEERVAFDRIVERVGAEGNLLSKAGEIYDTLKDAVEEYLKTDTVTIWEKNTAKSSTKKPFRLLRVAASKFMEQQYARDNINELPADCLTADAMNKFGQVTEVKLDENTIQRLAHAHIARSNNFKSIITIPISIGQETYAVADVFFRGDRHLTAQEKESLEQFAKRAAVAMLAVQNTKLIDSFGRISNTLLDEHLEVVLQNITDSALDVLHADPVILFRYELDQKKFLPRMISSGSFLHPEVKDVPEEITEQHWPSVILNLKEPFLYLENEQKYLEFQQVEQRVWSGDRFERDFWHREQIMSSAALRLEHDKQPLGVMFVNYRTSQKFNEPTKKLIQAFAAQGASAIANAKLLEQKESFWELQRRDSLSLSVSEIVTSLAHNSGNLVYSLSVFYSALDELLKKGDSKWVDREKAKGLADSMREPLAELVADFRRLQEYRDFSEFKEEECQVEELIDNTLQIIQSRIERNRIVVKKPSISLPPTPVIRCDKSQIQHLLLNLFINALDAMGRKGTLSVGTEVSGDGEFVRIRVSDSGIGIPQELHSKIFQPYFTTKTRSRGTGLGLSVSKYIAEEHGGSIEFTSRSGKETSFFILLPIERDTTDVESKGKNPHR